jgi:hypothetical protein
MSNQSDLTIPRPELELVIHHRYGDLFGETDLSGNGNHGYLVSPAAISTERSAGALVLDGTTSRVIVRPSASLRNLCAILVSAEIQVDELVHRRTVIEGFLAFSVVIESDARLSGFVYTGEQWFGVESQPGEVPVNKWVKVGFYYDGLSTFVLTLDGTVIAQRELAVGPIRSIEWPFGLNIGGWPDTDSRMFKGQIRELRLWRAAHDSSYVTT